MKHLVVALLIVQPFTRSWAVYPVIDVSDLPVDIQAALQQTYEVIEEIEKYQTMVQQLRHYYKQAEKLAKGDVSIDDFLSRTFDFHWQRDVLNQFWEYGDADLQELVALYDGAYDLKSQLGRLKSKFDRVFSGPKGIGSWRTGDFEIDGELRDLQERREAQIAHLNASIRQSMAWAGENKYGHEEDRSIYELTDRIWTGYQNDDDDDRGRQLAYDPINADLQTLKEVEMKIQRMLQSYDTTRALKQAKQLNELEIAMKTSERALKTIDDAINEWQPVNDQVVR